MFTNRGNNLIAVTRGDDKNEKGSTTNSTGPLDTFMESNKKGLFN